MWGDGSWINDYSNHFTIYPIIGLYTSNLNNVTYHLRLNKSIKINFFILSYHIQTNFIITSTYRKPTLWYTSINLLIDLPQNLWNRIPRIWILTSLSTCVPFSEVPERSKDQFSDLQKKNSNNIYYIKWELKPGKQIGYVHST